jgi:hypothetical protein
MGKYGHVRYNNDENEQLIRCTYTVLLGYMCIPHTRDKMDLHVNILYKYNYKHVLKAQILFVKLINNSLKKFKRNQCLMKCCIDFLS